MARPTKPKDLKPKTDGEIAALPTPAPGGGGGAATAFDLKFIILLVAVVIASVAGSLGSSYLMATMVVVPEIQKVSAGSGDADAHEEADAGHGGAASAIGMNLELDEFTVNLKPDERLGGTQYLRSKMAISIRVPEAENCYLQQHANAEAVPQTELAQALPADLSGGVIAGAAAPLPVATATAGVDETLLAAGGGPAPPSCEEVFKNNMGRYVPTIRDVINAALMKRTATALATLEGQESLKDEIREQLNQMMAPNYEVLRVNFQDFIIQR